MRQRLFLVLLIGLSIFSDAKETVMKKEVATLGGGCFWCLEAVFEETRGVLDVVSGYAGGDVKHPSYAQVSGGKTNHAEVVQIHFDADVISFEEILKIFWLIHDPTTLNAQGADKGTQYRSVIYYSDEAQKQTALSSIATAQEGFDEPIVTELALAPEFFEAEAYHQNYFTQHPTQGYCYAVVAPKVEKFMKTFAHKVK